MPAFEHVDLGATSITAGAFAMAFQSNDTFLPQQGHNLLD